MKICLALLPFLIAGGVAHAEDKKDEKYLCAGKDASSNDTITFSILFEKYRNGEFTDRTIEINEGYDEDTGENTWTYLQMYGATSRNQCQKTKEDEIYIDPKNFSLIPTASGDPAPLKASFQLNCKNDKYRVVAACYPAQ